ncbi:hypothetical protein SERLA73DRAFT_121705 [Serpula lacrymans var. lacrymans S7.3]|uniref:Alpha-ketoglutarate-dependent dioxygenase AlkB-like domain-containing protein n=2 Tax=Serpula lacrymans var. lacrymans TaxID=341189 RepID=F8PVV5_SERL3|nr:hypothetical protein SERLA73DRAFT_121705 [Serpula lacrymans var. lacrymans S7.3]
MGRPRGFEMLPDFFNLAEQRILLAAALQKLNSSESRHVRKRQKAFEKQRKPLGEASSIQDMFLPDDHYTFEQGHYDNVIHGYREMHVSSWPVEENLGLSLIFDRLQEIYPSQDTQTHLLHLSSTGKILPHVDNVEASGSWILGISLGAERIMHMESTEDPQDTFDTLLPSGSVYIQRDAVRFGYKHSILFKGEFRGLNVGGGQRLSMMVRDRKPPIAL